MLQSEIHQSLIENGYDLKRHFDACTYATRHYAKNAEKTEDFLFDASSYIAWTQVCEILNLQYNLITQPVPIDIFDKESIKEFGVVAQKFLKKYPGLLRTDASILNFNKRISKNDKFAGLKRGINGKRNIPIVGDELWEKEYWSTFSSTQFFIEEIDPSASFDIIQVYGDQISTNNARESSIIFIKSLCDEMKERSIIPHHPAYEELSTDNYYRTKLNFVATVQRKGSKVSLFNMEIFINPEDTQKTITQIKEGNYDHGNS